MAFIGVLWLVGAGLAAILPVTITMGPAVFYLICLVSDILPSFPKNNFLNGVDVNA